MGKQNQIQKSKSSKSEMDEYDSEIDELYRPFLIHSTTYALLTEQILSLMPSDRNVLLTMNEYDLSDINPMHPKTTDSPTHIIIFCVRFIADDIFQPIGGLLIYKHKDQSVILAECLKAYINDLWKLGLYVVGTVSPPFASFKGMLRHLVDVNDFDTYSGSLIYSVAPVKEIIHIYDMQFLLIKLQNLFKEGDIKFVENCKEYRASWNDISLVLNLSSEFKILSSYLTDNRDISRRVHIFTQQIFEQLLELDAQNALSKNAGGSAVLLNCIRSFLQFTELDLVDLNLMCQMDGWNTFIHILHSMTFQKSKKRTCTKTKPTTVHTIINPSVRRKIEFSLEHDLEKVEKVQNVDDILLIDESENNLENGCQLLKSCAMSKIGNKINNKKNKQKKSKRDSKRNSADEINILDNDKQLIEIITTNKAEISMNIQKTDLENKHTSNFVKENNEDTVFKKSVENKHSIETDNFLGTVPTNKAKRGHTGNKFKFNCDIDNNNNNDESLQSNEFFKTKRTNLKVKNDNKVKLKSTNRSTNRNIVKEDNFDIVIKDHQKFLESFIGCNISANGFNVTNIEEVLSCNLHTVAEDLSENEFIDVEEESEMINNMRLSDEKGVDYNDFCSQTDEETENCVTKICDKVPTIVESLSSEEVKEAPSDDFEENDVTCEILCTVSGMKKLMQNLINRRVRIAKPDSFVVEHIDFFVTVIKRDKNRLTPVFYYGHNYDFLNAELAFSSLQNTTGLYLVKT